jgi:PAS domain S-box-containing protein
VKRGSVTRYVSTLLEMAQDHTQPRKKISLPDWVEANFRLLLDAAPDAMLVVSETGQIVLANTQAETMFGIPRQNLAGKPIEVLIPERYRDRHSGHRSLYAADPRLRPMGVGLELYGLRKNSEEFPVEISLSPLKTDAGSFVMAAIRDIADRKRTQEKVSQLNRELQEKIEELRRTNDELAALRLAETQSLRFERDRAENELRFSEEHFRTIVERAPYGIYAAEEDGNIVLANPALVLMLGYDTVEEVLALNTVRDIYANPEERRKALQHWESSSHATPFETRWKRKDGKLITVRLAGRRLTPGTSLAMHEVFVENVTEQRILERQFQQAQRMEAVGRLAGSIAHDFNNLLMVIGSSAQMVQEAKQDPDKVEHYASIVRNAADKAAGLTRRLLAFSRQQVLQPAVLSLNDVVVDICKLLPRLLGEDIKVVLGLEEDLKNIYADRGQIEQALMNLAVNARDAMPGGGKLTIESKTVELDAQYSRLKGGEIAAGQYVMLAISDTGIGMSQEVQAQIFEPFFTTKEVGKGTGLGLASVYGTVRQSGGFIWVYSEPEKGSTFKLYFPAIEASGEAAEPPAAVKPESGGSEEVLLVEDEPTLRELTSAFLQSKGYRVLEASNGVQALELCRMHPKIAVLVTDVVMPELGGPALAAYATKMVPDLKVILMSGYTDRAIDQNVLEGGTEFLQKPFSFDTLTRTIRRVLDAGRETRS